MVNRLTSSQMKQIEEYGEKQAIRLILSSVSRLLRNKDSKVCLEELSKAYASYLLKKEKRHET